MASLTENRNTVSLHFGAPHYTYHRVSGSVIFAGAIAAQNADGNAVPASDAAGLIVLGRAESAAASGESLDIRRGAYLYNNGTSTEALTVADIGAVAYVVDDHTVGKLGGTNKVKAGTVLDVSTDGVAVLI